MDKKREKQRLDRLEGEAVKNRPATTGKRTWPSDAEWQRASRHSVEAWWELMQTYGWTMEAVEAEIERISTVHERCFESGLEDWQVISDMEAYLKAGGDLDVYPGPRPYWGPGGSVR